MLIFAFISYQVEQKPRDLRLLSPNYSTSQVVSYKVISKRGNRGEFGAMVKRCHAAGVRVLVDAVINRELTLS